MTTVLAVPEALVLADELAGQLSDPRAVWPDGPPPDGRFWPQSLASGAIGIALLHVERARSGRGDWKTAHTWLSLAAGGEITGARNANLFFGAPALALVLHIAASAEHRYQRTFTALDDVVIRITKSRLDEAHARIGRAEQPEMREFDLVRGLSGLATYHLACHPDHEITRKVLAYLARLTEPLPSTSTQPPWWTNVAPNGEPSSDYPQGHGNVGVSHGIGSVLAVLSLGALRDLGSASLTDAIARICTWTDQWRQGDADAPWWPGLITTGQARQGRVAPTLRPVPSWCYGVSGRPRSAAGGHCTQRRRPAADRRMRATRCPPRPRTALTPYRVWPLSRRGWAAPLRPADGRRRSKSQHPPGTPALRRTGDRRTWPGRSIGRTRTAGWHGRRGACAAHHRYRQRTGTLLGLVPGLELN